MVTQVDLWLIILAKLQGSRSPCPCANQVTHRLGTLNVLFHKLAMRKEKNIAKSVTKCSFSANVILKFFICCLKKQYEVKVDKYQHH